MKIKKMILIMIIISLIFPTILTTFSLAYNETENMSKNETVKESSINSTESEMEKNENIIQEQENTEGKAEEQDSINDKNETSTNKTEKDEQENKTTENEEDKSSNTNEIENDKSNTTEPETNEIEENKIQEYKTIENEGISLLSATSDTIEEGTYYIQTAVKSNMIFDIEGATKSNGAKLQLQAKTSPLKMNQKFVIKSTGNGYYTIQAKHSQKVLDVEGASKSNGAKVQQYASNGTDAQKWLLKKTSDGYYNIISKCNGLYLDIPGAIANNGVKINVYKGNGTNAQKFKLIKSEIVAKATVKDGVYKIKTSGNSNIGLEVKNSSSENSANVQVGAVAVTAKKNQRFQITHKGNGYYEIKAYHSQKVLDVAGGALTNGTNVQQYSSNGTDAQRWIIKDNGDGTYSIISKVNELYLDVNGGKLQNGSNIQTYDGNGTNAQKFKLEEVAKPTCKQLIKSGTYKIASALNNKKVLDISNGSNKNGANVQIWDSDTVLQQRFQITYNQAGYYEIKCSHSGKVLSLSYGGTTNGTNVEQYESNGTEAQRWVLQDAGNGYFYIVSRSAELYLDIAGGSTANGANLQIYEGNSTNAQKFKFIEADILEGIDVSEHQKLIDWRTARQTGKVDFAIIRCGFGSNTTTQDDKFFERNVLECERLGIPYGIYLYSYAGTREGGKSEAEHVLRLLKGKNPTFGIWIDMEDADGYKSKNGIAQETGVEVCDEFCKTIQSAGYNNVGIYANLSWLNGCLDDKTLDKYPKWVAQWNSKCDYKKPYVMWQYTSSGQVTGIIGNVDMNYYYK